MGVKLASKFTTEIFLYSVDLIQPVSQVLGQALHVCAEASRRICVVTEDFCLARWKGQSSDPPD